MLLFNLSRLGNIQKLGVLVHSQTP